MRQQIIEARVISQRKEKVRQNKAKEIKLRVINKMTEKLGKETISMILKEERTM